LIYRSTAKKDGYGGATGHALFVAVAVAVSSVELPVTFSFTS
jgi:hypothetical protein